MDIQPSPIVKNSKDTVEILKTIAFMLNAYFQSTMTEEQRETYVKLLEESVNPSHTDPKVS